MKSTKPIQLLLVLVAVASTTFGAPGKNCGCECCKDRPKGEACCCHEPDPATPAAIKRHSLKGVVTSVLADRSALMVRHEEIPGVMRAMTMLFKVDGATLQSARKGQGITGLMSRQGDDWVLEEVKLAAAKAP